MVRAKFINCDAICSIHESFFKRVYDNRILVSLVIIHYTFRNRVVKTIPYYHR